VANGFVVFFSTGILHHFLPVRNRFASHGKNSVKMHPSAALAAKTIVQTRKGDGKIPGTFQVVKAAGN
jgi:hypothetical protein